MAVTALLLFWSCGDVSVLYSAEGALIALLYVLSAFSSDVASATWFVAVWVGVTVGSDATGVTHTSQLVVVPRVVCCAGCQLFVPPACSVW